MRKLINPEANPRTMLPRMFYSRQRSQKKGFQYALRKQFMYGVTAIFILVMLSGCLFSQSSSEDVSWLIDVLRLNEGSAVADIGAGDGEEALAIANHVADKGQVYATELETESLEELRKTVEESETGNVTVIEGHPGRTNLPAQCCDAIYLRKVYHHLENPASMNASLFETLKPGGRLAIIDFPPFGAEEEAGERTSNMSHGVSAETVVKELREAGFILLSSDDKPGRNYYVVMQKPEADE